MTKDELIDAAYQAGWVKAAFWAERSDLIADIGSPAYINDRELFLGSLRTFTLVERTEPQEPRWYACETPGAEFDVTFVTSRQEAEEMIEGMLEDDSDLTFDSLVTPLYTAPQPERKSLQAMINADRAYIAGLKQGYNYGCVHDERGFIATVEAYQKQLKEAT